MRRLQPVKRSTLGEQVALQLAGMVTSGEWAAGQKLPSEAELCQMLGVGRSTVREALKSLAFVGMVEMRAGEGTFAAERQPNNFAVHVMGAGVLNTEKQIRDLAEARIVIECETAALCAQWGHPEDFEVLDDLLRRMIARGEDAEAFLDLDMAFHRAIARYSQNVVLTGMLEMIRIPLREYIVRSLHVPQSADVAHQQHAAILAAMRNRDAEAARYAMKTHLLTFVRAYAILSRMSEMELEESFEVAAAF